MAGIRTFIALEMPVAVKRQVISLSHYLAETSIRFQIAKLFLDLYTNVHYTVLYLVRCRRREGLRRDPKLFVRRDADDQTQN